MWQFFCHSLWQMGLLWFLDEAIRSLVKINQVANDTVFPKKLDLEFSKDFRLYLQHELVRRCRANSRYSLRAFASSLRINASTLSQILRGKRTLTPAQRSKLGMRLGLSPLEMAKFRDQKEKEPIPRDRSLASLRDAQELTLDVFQVISDWYHYAIFELVTVKGFNPSPRWIARKLGVSVAEVSAACERLMRIGLLVVAKNGKWLQGPPLVTTTGTPFTAVALRKLQAQVLSMAQDAMENIPMEFRDQSSITMAINSERLNEVKTRIKIFRRQLCDDLQKDKKRDSVYQLGISFYPLTKIENQ